MSLEKPRWWEHPSHVRKCKLARQDALEHAKALGARRAARQDLGAFAWRLALSATLGLAVAGAVWVALDVLVRR